jgi:hypothetical protein
MNAGMGIAELFIILPMLTGLFGGNDFLGMPPGERDARLLHTAPADAFLYHEWSPRGSGQPGAPGVDGVGADPEIQLFAKSVQDAIFTTIERVGPGPDRVFVENVPRLFRLLLDTGGCLSVQFDVEAAKKLLAEPPELPPGSPPWMALLPAVKATLVVNAGDNADKFAGHVQALLEMLPDALRTGELDRQKLPLPLPGTSLTLHRQKEYFILALGEGSLDVALKGLDGQAKGLAGSERFTKAMQRVAIERTASVTWLDLGGLMKQAGEGLGPQGMVPTAMAQILGLGKLDYLATCTGVVDGRITQRGVLKTGGQTEGVLAVAAGRPLKIEDFAHIPGDADLALGFSLDVPKVIAAARQVVAQADPPSAEVFDATKKQLEKELELSFEDDIFAAFGQVWTVYDSTASGGVLLTSPVVTLEVQDAEKAKQVFERLMEVLKLALPGNMDSSTFRTRGVFLTKHEFLGRPVHFINTVGDDDVPFAPAFCLTETHLVVALHPQALKGHLRAAQDAKGGFAEKAQKMLQAGGDQTISASYVNPEPAVRALLAIAPMFSQIIFSEIQREGAPIDTFAWPSARAFLPYLQDAYSYLARTEDGLKWETQSVLPLPGSSSLVTVPAAMVPAFVAVRRVEAQQFGAPAAIEVQEDVKVVP